MIAWLHRHVAAQQHERGDDSAEQEWGAAQWRMEGWGATRVAGGGSDGERRLGR